MPQNIAFYLAIRPADFGPVVASLGAVGLLEESVNWRRVVIEKPFGYDLDSARQLQQQLRRNLHEEQIYRCLPADHPDRNSRMVHESLTRHIPIPEEQVHPMRGELGAEAAARDYQALLRDALPFHMVLLGLGEDGHTASLFPGQNHPAQALVVPVHDAPKPTSDRVSLSARALAETENLLFLVTGEGKRKAVRRWRENEAIPASGISTTGRTEVLIDQSAWPE